MLGSSSTVVFLKARICLANLVFVVVIDDTPISTDSIDLISCCSDIKGASVSVEAGLWHVSCGRAVKTQCLMSIERFKDTINVRST